MVDLPDGRILGEQQPVTPAEVGDVAQQHEHADDPAAHQLWDRLHQERGLAPLDLLGDRQPGADGDVDRILVESHLGEVEPRRVRADPERVHRDHRVRPGQAHPQVGIEQHHAVAHPRGVLELVVVLAEREAALGDHRREASKVAR